MTFKDLKRSISYNSNNLPSYNKNTEKITKLQSERFAIFQGKPFWISNVDEHKKADIVNKGACCFNHIIGLSKKDGKQLPIFDYEMQLTKALDKLELRQFTIKQIVNGNMI